MGRESEPGAVMETLACQRVSPRGALTASQEGGHRTGAALQPTACRDGEGGEGQQRVTASGIPIPHL